MITLTQLIVYIGVCMLLPGLEMDEKHHIGVSNDTGMKLECFQTFLNS